MAPAAAKPARKRNRKRKRRAASSGSSSSSSSEEETRAIPSKTTPTKNAEPDSESSSSSSESDSDSDSSESNSASSDHRVAATITAKSSLGQTSTKQIPRRMSASPSPPPATIPSFLPSGDGVEIDSQHDQIMRDRFRKFWLTAVADGFKDDLEEIRKEPNLGTSRLALLVDSLAAGADIFPSQNAVGVNEVEVVLG